MELPEAARHTRTPERSAKAPNVQPVQNRPQSYENILQRLTPYFPAITSAPSLQPGEQAAASKAYANAVPRISTLECNPAPRSCPLGPPPGYWTCHHSFAFQPLLATLPGSKLVPASQKTCNANLFATVLSKLQGKFFTYGILLKWNSRLLHSNEEKKCFKSCT